MIYKSATQLHQHLAKALHNLFQHILTTYKSDEDDETFYECWERFKDLQKQCPPQLIPAWDLV